MKKKRILLSFIGNNDCQPVHAHGAILSILDAMPFDNVYLLYNHDRYLKPGGDIIDHCRQRFPEMIVKLQAAPAENPTDYNVVYPAMFQAVQSILRKEPDGEFTISLTSGTPVMHACWIFLRQGGVIQADLIQVSREAGISEVSFRLDDFPEIQGADVVKVEMTRLSRENAILRGQRELKHDGMIGECPPIRKMKEQILMFADAAIPLFIRGETGTGKELVAEALHYNSSRKEKPLVRVNCGAIPPELFESVFFGHKKGAFTGAVSDQAGFIRQADGGTLFLDEIAEMPLAMQVKLLRFLDRGAFTPVGRSMEETADVRVVAASHQDLRELVREKKFREDLFYRLVTVEVVIPPLRDRGEDKALIAHYFLERLNARHGKRKRLGASALRMILFHHWPGNARQLRSALEAAYLAAPEEIGAEHVPVVEVEPPVMLGVMLPEGGVDLEGDILPSYYRAALKKSGGNAAEAARLLGLKPHTFRARLKMACVKI